MDQLIMCKHCSGFLIRQGTLWHEEGEIIFPQYCKSKEPSSQLHEPDEKERSDTPTPRTDVNLRGSEVREGAPFVEFARTLERELATALDHLTLTGGKLAACQRERDSMRSELAIAFRAIGNWREWPNEAASDHAHVDWQVAARAIIERDALREALVRYNDNARSFFQIANRVATEFSTHELATNFGGFAEATHTMLKETHAITNEARAAIDAARKA